MVARSADTVSAADRSADQIRALADARDRTLALVAGLSDDDLARVVDPLLSPLLWDLGHIANFEQRWLLGEDDGDLDGIYNPFDHPRAERGGLPVLNGDQCFTYMGAVRERVLARESEFDPVLLELVIQHEQQHNETILQLLRQMDGYVPPPALRADFTPPPSSAQHIRLREAASRAYRPVSRDKDWIGFPAGEYAIGSAAGEKTLVYDNEIERHTVPLGEFEIAARPVTAGDFAEWIDLGGYERPEWWSREGWYWLREQGEDFTRAPLGWRAAGDLWLTSDFGEEREVEMEAPVCHVNWFEADAYARAHAARLPTEFEWEVAASCDPRAGASGPSRLHSWGDHGWSPGAANLDQLAFGVLRVGAADHGFGPIDMNGQVWEWTSSEFGAYPGFTPFAYKDYSAPFFDQGYRVLRGGSWATRARSVDNRFRNWDHPERRQIFSGLRLARSL
ncbi:MAG: SUMF1/EgtB/PvdO family nonheme iron enzyme [Solirubrobacterales bacterium]